MAVLQNTTPHANLQFMQTDRHGREFGVYMIKTAYDILDDGSLRLSDEQEPFVLTDQFHGELNVSPLRYASDLVPYKPLLDVALNATTFAPLDEPSQGWSCSVSVWNRATDASVVTRDFDITGPREWQKTWRGWRVSDATPIRQLNLTYEHAYGGLYQTPGDPDTILAYERNPVGQGFVKPDTKSETIPAPQILLAGETLDDPFAERTPAGVGPIPAAWLPRRPLGGTYDDNWQQNVWPNWPADYDFRFHNAASNGFALDVPEDAPLELRLRNMHPERAVWTIDLPRPDLVVLAVTGGQVTYHRPKLDTLFVDIAADRLADPRVFAVSRLIFDWQTTEQLFLMYKMAAQAKHEFRPSPHPDRVARPPVPDDQPLEVPA